jgi:hypothetical protein
MPLVAVCLMVLLGFGGLAVDVGYWEYQQREQQNATDAAAIGGAQQLAYSGCNSQTAATTAADNDSAKNGFADAGNVAIAVSNPPSTGAYAGNTCAVDVQITTSKVASFFTRLFGQSKGVTDTTEAVAQVLASSPGCVYLLDPTGTPDFHGAKMTAPGCGMLINGSPTFDGGDIDFSDIGYAGGSDTEHGTKFVEASPVPMVPVADPCPEISGCSSLAQNPPATTGCAPLVATGVPINPGCYSSISGNGSITMNPGLYVLTGSNSLNGATVTGSGVTIYVTSTGTGIDFHGTKVNLSACTTSCAGGAVSGVLYYQGTTNTSPIDIAGPSGSYCGLIYAPGSNVTYDGNAGSCYSVMVFDDWTLNGTGQGMTFASPPPNQSLINQVVLGQ